MPNIVSTITNLQARGVDQRNIDSKRQRSGSGDLPAKPVCEADPIWQAFAGARLRIRLREDSPLGGQNLREEFHRKPAHTLPISRFL